MQISRPLKLLELRTTRGFLLCWLQNISSSIYRLSALLRSARSDVSQVDVSTELWNIPSPFYLYPTFAQASDSSEVSGRAEVTRNISTAESPGRWWQFCWTLQNNNNLSAYLLPCKS